VELASKTLYKTPVYNSDCEPSLPYESHNITENKNMYITFTIIFCMVSVKIDLVMLGKRQKISIFLLAYSGGWSPNWVHSATRPFTVLLCLHLVIVRMENYSVE
jgi:hypothetical protein